MKTRVRLDQFTTVWMAAALAFGVLTAVGKLSISTSWWMSIHIITLGVLSNAILQWSWYFARSLLRLPRNDRRGGRDQIMRQWAFNIALVVTVTGMWAENLPAVIVGAAGIGAVLAWHGAALLLASRGKLGSRFSVVIRYYVAASAALVIGCVLAGFIAGAMFSDSAPSWLLAARPWLTMAHSLVNGLGWLGLSIAGTLVTLGPTMLRTRMIPGAVARAQKALPAVALLALAAPTAAALSQARFAGVFVVGYTVALAWAIGLPLVEAALGKAPKQFPTWSMTAGLVWGAAAALALGAVLIGGGSLAYESARGSILAFAAAGGVLQILVGALAYLMPVAIGHGPAAVRLGIAVLESGSAGRVLFRNSALVLALVSGLSGAPPMARVWWVAVVASYALDFVLFSVAGVKQSRRGRDGEFVGMPASPSRAQRAAATALPDRAAEGNSGRARVVTGTEDRQVPGFVHGPSAPPSAPQPGPTTDRRPRRTQVVTGTEAPQVPGFVHRPSSEGPSQ